VNGLVTSDFPTVGALLSGSDASNAAVVCSGTLVGCHTFVTAAHCVCQTTGAACQGAGAPDKSKFFVFLQHGGFFNVASIALPADFDFPVADVAVLELATPVTGIAPTPINETTPVAFGTPATIVGYGDTAGTLYDYGVKRTGQVATAACSNDISSVTSLCFNFAAPIGPAGTDSDTCNGDSGGPLFVDFGCGPTLAGTTSGGSSISCDADDDSFDANIYTYRDFIRGVAGDDLDSRSCGDMPQVGDPGTTVAAFAGAVDLFTTSATNVFAVPPGTTELRVTMNAIDDGHSDFDLYVKRGAPPTTTDFDCQQASSSQFAVCRFPSPAAGAWYFRVQRYTGEGTYQVTATSIGSGSPGPGSEGQSCSDGNGCTVNDVCVAGKCVGASVADGAACDDGRACTQADTCHAGVCRGTAAPLTGCRDPFLSRRASLFVRNMTPNRGDKLQWKWSRGARTTVADFGDPTTTSAYDLCVFDQEGGVDGLALETSIPPGQNWARISQGFQYRDKLGADAGITAVTLKAGTDGTATIAVKGRGANLALPDLPFHQDGRVTVQLVGPNACWEARYSTSSANVEGEFRAKAD